MNKKEKKDIVKKLKKKIEENELVGIVNMHKLPAKQLQEIKQSLRERAEIKMSKKTLMKLSLEGSKKESIKSLEDHLKQEPTFLFSNENPFRLFSFLKKNKTKASAKVGDVIPEDIIVKKTATNLTPGPAISQLQKVGLETTVQDGKIVITKDKKIVEKGTEVNQDVVDVLNMLNIEPMEIGLNLVCVHEKGTLYTQDVLDIDEEDYKDNVENSVKKALTLSINSGFLVPETAAYAIQLAARDAKTVALESGMLTTETVAEKILQASFHANHIEDIINEEVK